MTRPPGGPGIAPFTINRLRSASTATTSRLRTVTRSLPIWPAIRVPLNTRLGVALGGLDLCDVARAGLDHRHRHRAGVLEELGHAQFLAQDPLELGHQAFNFTSMSTPADSCRRWSSCTVLGVASWMSMSRLCVSIWKCSGLSSSLCGERITV